MEGTTSEVGGKWPVSYPGSPGKKEGAVLKDKSVKTKMEVTTGLRNTEFIGGLAKGVLAK